MQPRIFKLEANVFSMKVSALPHPWCKSTVKVLVEASLPHKNTHLLHRFCYCCWLVGARFNLHFRIYMLLPRYQGWKSYPFRNHPMANYSKIRGRPRDSKSDSIHVFCLDRRVPSQHGNRRFAGSDIEIATLKWCVKWGTSFKKAYKNPFIPENIMFFFQDDVGKCWQLPTKSLWIVMVLHFWNALATSQAPNPAIKRWMVQMPRLMDLFGPGKMQNLLPWIVHAFHGVQNYLPPSTRKGKHHWPRGDGEQFVASNFSFLRQADKYWEHCPGFWPAMLVTSGKGPP